MAEEGGTYGPTESKPPKGEAPAEEEQSQQARAARQEVLADIDRIFKREVLPRSTKLDSQDAQYLVYLATSAIEGIMKRVPTATPLEVIELLDDSRALLKHPQTVTWLRSIRRGPGGAGFKTVDDIGRGLAASLRASRTRQEGEEALSTLTRVAGEDLLQLAERYKQAIADAKQISVEASDEAELFAYQAIRSSRRLGKGIRKPGWY